MPPNGGWNAQYTTCRKPVIAPMKSMKPLFWQRIQVPGSVQPPPTTTAPSAAAAISEVDGDVEEKEDETSCLWNKLEEKENIINEEFLERYSRKVTKPANKKLLKINSDSKDDASKVSSAPAEISPKKKQKPKPIQLLEQKRAHNIGILITSLRLDVQFIETAVLNHDASSIGTDKLQQIEEVAATQEEIRTIEQHLEQNPNADLGKAERFLYDLSKIPQFTQRVKCIMHEIKFSDLLVNIDNTLSTFRLTCSTLTSKKSIQDIFAIILTFGNCFVDNVEHFLNKMFVFFS